MSKKLKKAGAALMAAARMKDTGECVKVVVRCRPLNSTERGDKRNICVGMDESLGQVALQDPAQEDAEPKLFTFDAVYGMESLQTAIYEETASPLVDSVLEGYNGTIFAYGQTGCGKTFTMMGPDHGQNRELRGIIPQAFDHIFAAVDVTSECDFLIRASYIEIYNEEIRDLLSREPKIRMEMKESPEHGVYIKDLTAVVVNGVAEIDKVMQQGAKSRTTGATLMNAESSRSHSVFTIVIETSRKNAEGENSIRAGKLNLVDLAGSERQGKTGAAGQRLKEATKINLSLSALGNVIAALASGKTGHIPYRDSKLTRMLQDSLGGNTKTIMVANIGPADYNYDETASTLRYANRAKNIKNKPKINEDPKDALLRQFQEEIERLKSELLAAAAGGGAAAAAAPAASVAVAGAPQPAAAPAGSAPSADDGSATRELEALRAQMRTELDGDKLRMQEEKVRMMEEVERERQEKQQLAEQLQALQHKIVAGGDMQSPAKGGGAVQQDAGGMLQSPVRAAVGQANTKIVDEGRRRKQEEEQERLYFDEEQDSLQDELVEKDRKLKKLRSKLRAAVAEIEDLQNEFVEEKEDLLDAMRSQERELRLYKAIALSVLPKEKFYELERTAQWDDADDRWIVAGVNQGDDSYSDGSLSDDDGGLLADSSVLMQTQRLSTQRPSAASSGEQRPSASSGRRPAAGGLLKASLGAGDKKQKKAVGKPAPQKGIGSSLGVNLVLFGAQAGGGGVRKAPVGKVGKGGKAGKGGKLPSSKAPARVGKLGRQPAPRRQQQQQTLVEVQANRRAEQRVAADAQRWQAGAGKPGRGKLSSASDELAFAKQIAGSQIAVTQLPMTEMSDSGSDAEI